MKTLELRFKTIQENNPNYGAYIAFANAVNGQKFNKQIIHRWFYELVPKEDYDAEDKKDIFKNLEWLTKQPEEYKKRGVNASVSRSKTKEVVINKLTNNTTNGDSK
jgi:hypothetical protein